ncbi:MAG: AbrB/MazE/SpoVT family DNA-binding domain-containing protein [Gemmatimonadota bacterium]|nr:AbrB/MazE/SpoVT family DNA-binding domain-containing protein [Gemmatimonadota bacterium]
MFLKIDSEGRVTLPKSVLNTLGVGPGDQIEIIEGPDGYILRPPRKTDYSSLGTLKDKIRGDHEPLDIHVFREQPYDPSLRD